MLIIPIYNMKLPKRQRVFDVEIDDKGIIRRYLIQNIRGNIFVDSDDVQLQIDEYMKKEKKIG